MSSTLSDPLPITDDPINRTTIDKLTLSQLEAMVAAIRERRLTIVRKVADIKAAKLVAKLEGLQEKFDKQADRVAKAINKATVELDKVDDQLNKLRALAMQMEDADGH